MNSENKYKILIMVIVILSVITLGLTTFIIYDKFISSDEICDKDTKDDNNKTNANVKYEEMSENEINQFLKDSRLFYYLNRQENTITNMNIIFEENNYNMLEETVKFLFNYDAPQTFITEEEIKEECRKLYGFDIDFDYTNLGEGDSIAFEWDDVARRYIVLDPSIYGHGMMFYDVDFKITDVKKNSDNSYDITTRQIWSNEQSEGDYPERFYFSYYDAMQDSKPMYTIQLKDDELGYDFDGFGHAFKEAEKYPDQGYYTYRIVKENGNIKITQYIINI